MTIKVMINDNNNSNNNSDDTNSNNNNTHLGFIYSVENLALHPAGLSEVQCRV